MQNECQNIVIPRISQKEFWGRLKKRKYEEIEVIQNIESFFLKKRGYIFRIPKKGEKVILLVSGGMDSVIQWAILMEIFKLEVYPISFHNSQNYSQYDSIKYFSKFFNQKYSNLYHEPYLSSHSYLPEDFISMFKTENIDPRQILDIYDVNNKTLELNRLKGLSNLHAISAFFYIQYLLLTKNIKINTIFCGVVAGDGTVVPSQTFTFLRSTMYFLALLNRDFSLQFGSLFLEKELGIYLEKNETLKLGYQMGIPLEKTYSCYYGKSYRNHCGICISCKSRKFFFKKAGIQDKTKYNNTTLRYKLMSKLNYHIVNRDLCKTILKKFKQIIFIIFNKTS